MSERTRGLAVVVCLFAAAGASLVATDYLTEGADNARTGWLRTERILTGANVGSSRLLWKAKLPGTVRQMHHLFAPLVKENVATPAGAKELAIVAGVSDEVFALDAASGQIVWHRTFDSDSPDVTTGAGSALCPGGQTAVPVIDPEPREGRTAVYAVSWDGRLRTIDIATGQDLAPPDKFLMPNGKPYALNLFDRVIYTSTAQGCGGNTNAFHSYDLTTRRASTFAPGGGGLWGRRGVAIDPQGRVFMGTGDGLYIPEQNRLGNAIVAVKLDANKQLQLVDHYAPPNANWLWRRDLDLNVTPVAFDYRGRKFLVGTSKECRLWLLDRDNLGGSDHRTALHVAPLTCNDSRNFAAEGVWGALAVWVDSQDRQWLFVPFYGPVSREFEAPVEHARPVSGGVAAYTVEQRSGRWQLVPQWLSADMDMAEHALVANGVVFVYASGEDTSQLVPDRAWDDPRGGQIGGSVNLLADRRGAGSRHATMYALDAQTGRQLWSSGREITSWNHYSGMTVANGRMYLATFDGMVYAFGVTR